MTVTNAATIVSAYLRNHNVAVDQIPSLIQSVHAALGKIDKIDKPDVVALPVPLTPAVSVRKSVQPHAVTCLECGFAGQMIRRHLTTQHGLSVDAYRTKWGLQSDYPVVAPNYAERRSALAKQIGLGTRARR